MPRFLSPTFRFSSGRSIAFALLPGFLAVSCALHHDGARHAAKDDREFLKWAERPPMGWNSWDCFGTAVTERLTKTNADYMAEHLAVHGWNYVVVDIQWYEPQSSNWDYSLDPKPVLDEFGRLLPVVAKFPSSAGGEGFGPLARYVHDKGLKFGVHLMRGIPREAVKRNTAILGTPYHAADIADRTSICRWNPDMFGVDTSKPGAQEYYDSVFKLLASWGVDFVKVDDVSSPYHAKEIEAIHAAIERCGRPMVLSLSPGPTPLSDGAGVMAHANMWRLVDDLWDNWQLLWPAFEKCDEWTPYRGAGHWPDIDMLPLGAISVGPELEHHSTRFTQDEQRTLMTLWCIARAPLIFGGHLPWNDGFTLSLITNDEVLAVDQQSADNRQLFHTNDVVAWTARVPGSDDRYLALFHAPEKDVLFDESKALFRSEVVRGLPGAQLAFVRADIAGVKRLYLHVGNGGDGSANDHADWIVPKLAGPRGELRLTDLKWISASSGSDQTRINRSATDRPLIVNGTLAGWGIGTHADSVIEYELPEGYDRFEALGVLDPSSGGKGSVQFEVYADAAATHHPATAVVSVPLSALGFTGSVRVRDLWAQRDVGESAGIFSRVIPTHGSELFRISPAQ